ncbi:uncharacterized protein MELLADRAFT_59746 [Melampsora larici-populina 98AG31]|uniref:Uncharacterized protein n=1 Tax=Melampsora larici-populina (strain 98AG31 / pathotype 3-4-7) TaxID=747676 RepID=F4R750_MELLP|nr:uncharacterized protein MELLADRAFT_59746 [Melampsora larici-populina 98AG31]EGG11576.1 hypothetical protein MELLADRAFT_59746 [Melampsora larici-populina 98AG31]
MTTKEGKKEPKRPVILDLGSDSSMEDIEPDLPIDNQRPCNLETPARQEDHNNDSDHDLSDSIILLEEKPQSRPSSINQASSHPNSESCDIDLVPYDELEDQLAGIDRDHIDMSTERQIQSHTPSSAHTLACSNSSSLGHNDELDEEIEYIQAQQVNTDQDLINLSLDEQNKSNTPSRIQNLPQSTSFSLDHLDYDEEMNRSEIGKKEDRLLILTHLNEESSIEELIKFVKTGEDPKKKIKSIKPESKSDLKLPQPLRIWCDLNSRGYPKSLWDFVSKSKRNYIGEKFNHGNSNHRFIIIEYEFNFQKELGYKFFKGGVHGSNSTFYSGSVMVHFLDDLNDLKGCDCIYDQNPEIITCKIVRENFQRLIKTLISIGQERKEKDLKPVWQKLTKEIIEDNFTKSLNDEDLMVGDFNEYLKEASRVGIVRMSKVIVGKDLNQVDLLGLGESIVHWQLMKPFRKLMVKDN